MNDPYSLLLQYETLEIAEIFQNITTNSRKSETYLISFTNSSFKNVWLNCGGHKISTRQVSRNYLELSDRCHLKANFVVRPKSFLLRLHCYQEAEKSRITINVASICGQAKRSNFFLFWIGVGVIVDFREARFHDFFEPHDTISCDFTTF